MSNGTVLTIILNYRTPDMTLECAEAALAAMRGLPGEILIVDNASGDGSCEKIREAADARGWTGGGRLRVMQSTRNGGFGAGNNIGIRNGLSDGSRPDFYYLLNSDAFTRPDTIRQLRDFLRLSPRVGLVGSRVVGVDGAEHCTAFRFPTLAGEFEGSVRLGVVTRLLRSSVVPMGMPAAPTRLDWTAGASLMIRREVIEEVGGFDETFFLYYEETDLCYRAAEAGWETWYLPGSEVAHVGSASTGMKGWSRIPGYWLDSRLHYFSKTHGAWYAAAATLARITGGALYGLRRRVSGKPQVDPECFTRDLITHSIRALFAPRSRLPDGSRLYTPLPEKPE